MNTWIFLRGLTRESRHWGDFPEEFCREVPEVKVCCPDLPGNGVLSGEESPLSVEEMLECIRAQLNGQDIMPPYHLLAMSLGAMVAVSWAAKYPEEIRGCVLINTSLRSFSAFYRRLKPGSYGRLLKLGLPGCADREREQTVFELTSHRPERADQVLKAWVAHRLEYPVRARNALRQLLAAARFSAPPVRPPVPILVLVSRNDALVDASCSHRIARHWVTALAEHPTAGHDLPLDDGAWVARRVSDWLKSQP